MATARFHDPASRHADTVAELLGKATIRATRLRFRPSEGDEGDLHGFLDVTAEASRRETPGIVAIARAYDRAAEDGSEGGASPEVEVETRVDRSGTLVCSACPGSWLARYRPTDPMIPGHALELLRLRGFGGLDLDAERPHAFWREARNAACVAAYEAWLRAVAEFREAVGDDLRVVLVGELECFSLGDLRDERYHVRLARGAPGKGTLDVLLPGEHADVRAFEETLAAARRVPDLRDMALRAEAAWAAGEDPKVTSATMRKEGYAPSGPTGLRLGALLRALDGTRPGWRGDAAGPPSPSVLRGPPVDVLVRFAYGATVADAGKRARKAAVPDSTTVTLRELTEADAPAPFATPGWRPGPPGYARGTPIRTAGGLRFVPSRDTLDSVGYPWMPEAFVPTGMSASAEAGARAAFAHARTREAVAAARRKALEGRDVASDEREATLAQAVAAAHGQAFTCGGLAWRLADGRVGYRVSVTVDHRPSVLAVEPVVGARRRQGTFEAFFPPRRLRDAMDLARALSDTVGVPTSRIGGDFVLLGEDDGFGESPAAAAAEAALLAVAPACPTSAWPAKPADWRDLADVPWHGRDDRWAALAVACCDAMEGAAEGFQDPREAALAAAAVGWSRARVGRGDVLPAPPTGPATWADACRAASERSARP